MLQLNTISSCIFVTNVVVLFMRGLNRHGFLFSLLFFTSVLEHELRLTWTHALDQIVLYAVFLNGGWLVYKRFRLNVCFFLAFSTCLLTIYLYHYGKLTDGYCFDLECGFEWHAFLHVVSSVGHHAIAFM